MQSIEHMHSMCSCTLCCHAVHVAFRQARSICQISRAGGGLRPSAPPPKGRLPPGSLRGPGPQGTRALQAAWGALGGPGSPGGPGALGPGGCREAADLLGVRGGAEPPRLLVKFGTLEGHGQGEDAHRSPQARHAPGVFLRGPKEFHLRAKCGRCFSSLLFPPQRGFAIVCVCELSLIHI